MAFVSDASLSAGLKKAFERYAPFTDLEALSALSAKPLRKSLRVNTLKCTVDELRSWGAAKDWMLEPVPWCPEAFFIDRVDREEALGKDLLHVLGHFYMQEAASMLPVTLLDPKPGERVLDMSAAPGSKTTQMAARMQNTGILIANDVQEKRIWSLITNLQRCAAVNAIVTRKVGQWFAGNMTEAFDRVLCDAPCTAQGTVRKDSDALTYCSLDNIGKMANLQRELLESAVHACKVGGRIVYSTCTLTPEENEGVVLSILNKFKDQLVIVDPSTVLTCDFSQAISDSAKIQASFGRADTHPMIRLWPQTYDTEGFFSVIIEKRAPTRDRTKKPLEAHRWAAVPKARAREITESLAEWYGTGFLHEGEILLENKEQLFILPEAVLHFFLPVLPYMTGLPFAKNTTHGFPRLSHEMATLRGHEATKQVLALSADDLKSAFRGTNLKIDSSTCEDGDVLLSMDSKPLGKHLTFGRGMLKAGTLLNRLPRDIVRMFS